MMSEWTKKRKCRTCGKEYSLSDHGHPGARTTALALESGGVDIEGADWFAAHECPPCAKNAVINTLAGAMNNAKRSPENRLVANKLFVAIFYGLLCVLIVLGFYAYRWLSG